MNNTLKKILYISIVIISILIIFSIGAFAKSNDEKCAWGFGRGKNHEQANLDSKPLAVLSNNGRNCNGKQKQ